MDNLALVPGNLLPQVRQWLTVSGEIPKDELVIVVPEAQTKQKETLTTVATLLRAHGHPVRLLREEDLESATGPLVQEPLGI